jgi:hypothetical protein
MADLIGLVALFQLETDGDSLEHIRGFLQEQDTIQRPLNPLKSGRDNILNAVAVLCEEARCLVPAFSGAG